MLYRTNHLFLLAVCPGCHIWGVSRQVNTSRLFVSSRLSVGDGLRNCRSMRNLSGILLLATATILCMTTHASPTQDLRLASPNSTTNTTIANRGGIACSRYDVGADIRACLSLLIGLPESTQDGSFHNAGPRDIFQLSLVLREPSCEVLVKLNNGRQDTSNWPAIRFAANQIIAACTRGNYPGGTVSGMATLGLDGNIQVYVIHPRSGDLGVA